MALIDLNEIQIGDRDWGGKAWGLGRLAREGYPVPPGLVLSAEPDEADFEEIRGWWKAIDYAPLAVRSSASVEDSAENSFAGQNKSFLNVGDEAALRVALRDCFASLQGESSQAYRRFFRSREVSGRMNVVVQKMVDARFAGVFFSEDPRDASAGWLLEVIAGLGEDLVSGSVTPGRLTARDQGRELPEGFTPAQGGQVAEMGQRVQRTLAFPLDMEWAIDQQGRLFVLQARPITALGDTARRRDLLQSELRRLQRSYPAGVTWDGQTFAEWTGIPSYFTFSLWKNAFSPHHSFGNALRELGYLSFVAKRYSPKDSLLERVFGRAYVNLDKLTNLYYGPIPYSIVPRPRPHTKFDWRKVNWRVIRHLPIALWRMLKVSWNLSTKRRAWLDRCSHELNIFKTRVARPLDPAVYSGKESQELLETLTIESWNFSKDYMHWPLLLVVLTESTMQRILYLLRGLFGEVEANRKLREWMGRGLRTVTLEMQEEFHRACADPGKRPYFLARYGHRGPGELDLVNPRWFELGDAAFHKISDEGPARVTKDGQSEAVEQEILALQSFKREMLLEEWRLLKRMLEHREQWKMELLKPYAQIRLVAEELGRRTGLGNDLHWLRLSEIEYAQLISPERVTEELRQKIRERCTRFDAFKNVSFPDVFTLKDVEGILSGAPEQGNESLDGEALSAGLSMGEVRVVTDPRTVDFGTWPTNTILVAEATDPGWTPLFARAKGIVVERGGVLSHCAIVAREMGIPAVSGIRHAHRRLKDGDQIWVDGHQGRISYESR